MEPGALAADSKLQDFNGTAAHVGAELFRKAHKVRFKMHLVQSLPSSHRRSALADVKLRGMFLP